MKMDKKTKNNEMVCNNCKFHFFSFCYSEFGLNDASHTAYVFNDPMPVPKLKNHPGLLRLLEPKSKSQPEKRYMFLDINKVC